jgi:hypothetical protein
MDRFIRRIEHFVADTWKWITDSLLLGGDNTFSSSQVWFQRFTIFSIYLSCVAVWSFFLNFGRIAWGVEDWIWEWRYARILKEAVTTMRIPLHTEPPLSYGVSRFLAIPDVPIDSRLLLLRFFDPGITFLITLLIMLTVSYIGCLCIKRHYQLSVFSFTALALLFNLNGFITSHIAAGHTLFTGYFLLPIFVLLTLRLMEGNVSKRWFAEMGLVLFGIELVGTTHIFAICVMFLGVLFLLTSKERGNILKALVIALAINVYRLVPAAVSLTALEKPPFAGFTTLSDLIKGLVWIIPPSESFVGLPIAWWEFDMYIGVMGLAFILFFGLRTFLHTESSSQQGASYRPLYLTMLIFSVFSIGYLYVPINYVPLPLFNLIHVPSRFLILPLLFMITLASVEIQSWLSSRSKSAWLSLALILLLAVLAHDLFQHARLWRLEYFFEAFPEKVLDLNLRILNQEDPAYMIVLAISWGISLIALASLFWRLARKDRTPQT